MAVVDSQKTGLPEFERFYLSFFLKLRAGIFSDLAVLRRFEQSSREILRVVDDHDFDLLSQQVAIPRLQGLEESSLNWSVLMVLDHLVRVNQTILETVRALRNGHQPWDKFRIAAYRPDQDVGAEVIEQFRAVNQRYWAFVKSHQLLRSALRHEHPWFGPLDGHGWHVFASAHQNIHRRQIFKILATTGVV
jgi:hypothetical protein